MKTPIKGFCLFPRGGCLYFLWGYPDIAGEGSAQGALPSGEMFEKLFCIPKGDDTRPLYYTAGVAQLFGQSHLVYQIQILIQTCQVKFKFRLC